MSLESAYYLSQIVAAFAVAGSLLFVGLQMRQNVRTQRAIMHQAVVSRTLDTTKFYYTSPHAEVFAKLSSVEESLGLTSGEVAIAGGILRLNIMNLEEAHWQRDNGFLTEDAVQSTIASSRRLFAMPGVRAAFSVWREAFSASQIALVERLGILEHDLMEYRFEDLWAANMRSMMEAGFISRGT